MWTTTTEANYFRKSTRRIELDGGAKGITDGKAEERSTLAIRREHDGILPSAVAFASQGTAPATFRVLYWRKSTLASLPV
jgi:hypothetical protein